MAQRRFPIARALVSPTPIAGVTTILVPKIRSAQDLSNRPPEPPNRLTVAWRSAQLLLPGRPEAPDHRPRRDCFDSVGRGVDFAVEQGDVGPEGRGWLRVSEAPAERRRVTNRRQSGRRRRPDANAGRRRKDSKKRARCPQSTATIAMSKGPRWQASPPGPGKRALRPCGAPATRGHLARTRRAFEDGARYRPELGPRADMHSQLMTQL